MWKRFDINIKNKKIVEERKKMKMVWSDGNESEYEMKWIIERSFEEKVSKEWMKKKYNMERINWENDEFEKIIKKYELNDIIRSDKLLIDWMENIEKYGINIIKKKKKKEDKMRKVVNRVDLIKRNNYGEEFMVKKKKGKKKME